MTTMRATAACIKCPDQWVFKDAGFCYLSLTVTMAATPLTDVTSIASSDVCRTATKVPLPSPKS